MVGSGSGPTPSRARSHHDEYDASDGPPGRRATEARGMSALRGGDRRLSNLIALEYPRREGAHMKAAFLTGFGDNEVVKFGDLPEPIRSDDAVLVEVHAAGVNPVEVVIRQGLFAALPANFPIIMGFDMSGIVLEAPGGAGFNTDDDLYGRPPPPSAPSANAISLPPHPP